MNVGEYPQNLIDLALNGYEGETTNDKPAAIEKMLSTLTEREQIALKYRYADNMTYKAIGNEMGISKSRASQLVAAAIRKMRHPYRKRYLILGVNAEQIERQREEERLAALKIKPYTEWPIDELNLSVRSLNCLYRVGITKVSDLLERMKDDNWAFRIRNLGVRCKEEIETTLAYYAK